MRGDATDQDALRGNWATLRAAWGSFSASMDRWLGQPTGGETTQGPAAAPAPPAPPPPDPIIAQREQTLITAVGTIAQDVAQTAGRIQTMLMTSSAWNPPSPQLVPQLIQIFDTAIGQFEQLLPEAMALAGEGHKDGLGFLMAHSDDSKQALKTYQAMIGQQQGFDADRTRIWADAGRAITATVQGINQNMSDTFARATQKYSDYLKG